MSAQVISVSPKRKFDFATLATGASDEHVVGDLIGVTPWREITMLVTVFNHTLSSGAGTIDVVIYARSQTAEDPGLIFQSSVTSLTINSTTPSPAFLSVAVPTLSVGDAVMVTARGTRSAAGTLDATISVQLSVKDV